MKKFLALLSLTLIAASLTSCVTPPPDAVDRLIDNVGGTLMTAPTHSAGGNF